MVPVFLRLRIVFILSVFALGFTLWFCHRWYPLALPQDRTLFAQVVVDESGRPLRAFADQKGVWRYPVSVEQVSPLYIEALLNYEDRWFWYHPGVNPLSLVRAAIQNLYHGRVVSGGSTLSMQVARLLHPHHRSLLGKAQQLLRTLQLEWQLDKTEILNLYLNIAPFGGTIEGVQAASFTYLNKSAADLTRAEAALMAVLPQAPTRYRPDLHHTEAMLARNKVLNRMARNDLWTKEQVREAKMEPVYAYRGQQAQIAPLLARRLLKKSNGQSMIKTTIDGALQYALEDYLRTYITRFPARTSAAILVIENDTAAVKAYLGSADFANQHRFGHVDMIPAIRSPGSTLKPFLFGLSLDEGLIHSHSLLADVPRSWASYRPSNFNNGYSGPVSASAALQRSLNMPFVDLLARYGPRRFTAKLRSAGLALATPGGEPNLAIILGGTGASLEQLVVSYRALAQGGKTLPLTFLQSDFLVTNHERHLLSPASAWITQRTLSAIARPDSLNTLATTQAVDPLAWKTGTSYGHRDAWAIGVSKSYTIGVWVGRPDGTSLPGHSGRGAAGPLLFAVADHLPLRDRLIKKPKEVRRQSICWPLGTLEDDALGYCHQRHHAWTIDGVVPPTWHFADSDTWQSNLFSFWVSASTGRRVNAHCGTSVSLNDKQKKTVALWPKVLEPWLTMNRRRARQIPMVDSRCVRWPTTVSSTLKITGIVPGSIYRAAGNSIENPRISLQALGGEGLYHWYINGVRQYSGHSMQVIQHSLKRRGVVQIVVVDDNGNIDKIDITVI